MWNPQTPLHTYLDLETYNLCLKNLANNKIPRPDKIPNSILKNMPASFQHILFLFFTHCYKMKQIPPSWKISLTILLYKKGDPSLLTNHRPIALANTIYKLFTSTLILYYQHMAKDIRSYMIAKKALEQKDAHPDNYSY